MSPRLNRQELAELKAHHVACSHLIKGCQDATIRLRRDCASKAGVADEQQELELRAVEILEEMLDSWCNTLSVLRANLDVDSPVGAAIWQMQDERRSSHSSEMASMAGRSGGRPRV
jgi:hypothetical protein